MGSRRSILKRSSEGGTQNPLHIYKSPAIMPTGVNSGSQTLPCLEASVLFQSGHRSTISFPFSKDPQRNYNSSGLLVDYVGSWALSRTEFVFLFESHQVHSKVSVSLMWRSRTILSHNATCFLRSCLCCQLKKKSLFRSSPWGTGKGEMGGSFKSKENKERRRKWPVLNEPTRVKG